jgi:hypothetical protein
VIRGAVNLTLLIGPVVPVPAPRFVLDALESVTVTESAAPNADSGFQLVFSADKRSPLATVFVLAGGAMPPILRVVLVVTVNGRSEVLVDGVVTEQQTVPVAGTGGCTMTVSGVDLTAVMGLIDLTGTPFPAMPVEARVALILAKYAFLGVVPAIIPSIVPETPNPTEQIPVQRGTDLAYLRHLADRTGYVFTIIPGAAPGSCTAYWGPQAKVGLPQPALNTDFDALTNVERLSFSVDTERREQPVIFVQNRETKAIISVPIPDVSPLNPPLGLIAPPAKRIRNIRETAKLPIPRAILLGMARASTSSDAVTAQGDLDVLRYGTVLRARRLVGVRGAGTAFDGLYFVQTVQHRLRSRSPVEGGSYTQGFTLVRNGLISTLPRIPV